MSCCHVFGRNSPGKVDEHSISFDWKNGVRGRFSASQNGNSSQRWQGSGAIFSSELFIHSIVLKVLLSKVESGIEPLSSEPSIPSYLAQPFLPSNDNSPFYVRSKFPRLACSLSIAWNKALKLPTPKPSKL